MNRQPVAAAPGSGDGDPVQAAIDALPLNPRHFTVFALCAAGLFFEALNLQLMSFVAPMLAREWHIGPAMLGGLISATIAGMLVGTYAFGAVADRFGRRGAFQITVGIFSILTALSGLAGTLGQLMVARFGAGLGIGGSIPVETAVLAEFTPARWRSRFMAIWAMALPVGALVAPLCVAVMPLSLGWRGLLLLGGLPAVLVLIVRSAIPETPQYLAGNGRVAEAEQALSWIARRPMPLAMPNPAADATARRSVRQAPEVLLFAAAYRRTTLVSWGIYFGSFFAYYGFVLWMPAFLAGYRGMATPEILRFMVGLALAGLVGRVAILLVAGRIDRRVLIAACSLGGAASLLCLAGQTDGAAIVISAFAAAFFLEGAFSAVIPFVAESYPTALRATGVGWSGGMGRFGTVLAPIVFGALVRIDTGYAMAALAAGALFAVASVSFARPVAGGGQRRDSIAAKSAQS
ncbi:MAG: hypothetical protein JWL96_442 [Sphingomonas bacterium]|uniref:MFS transporter n=1 Tax=Sphingomonas bacterium TaxID=1895847 RepID=UPI00262EFD22|nr:MFS transporter [Sphingomonas bacterium]MDB5708372.1 hypothetical protein [Sphingomonas bacterium]